jgi:hypothetical protein
MHNLYKQGNLPYLNVKLCPKCNELLAYGHAPPIIIFLFMFKSTPYIFSQNQLKLSS